MNTGLIIGIICLALVSIAAVVVIRMNKKTSPTTTNARGPTTSTEQDSVFEKVENEFKNVTL